MKKEEILWEETIATVLSTIIGVPLAWVLAKGRFKGKSVLAAFITLPMLWYYPLQY